MQIQPPPPKRSRREIRDATLPPVQPLPKLKLVTQEGGEGPSKAREEAEDTCLVLERRRRTLAWLNACQLWLESTNGGQTFNQAVHSATTTTTPIDHAYAAMEEAMDEASVDRQDATHRQEASASASVEEEGAAAPILEGATGSQGIGEGATGSQPSVVASYVDMEAPDTGYTAAEYAEMSYFDISYSIVASQSSQESCSEGSAAVYDPYQAYDLDDTPRVPARQERAKRALEGAGFARRDVMPLRKRASGAGVEMAPAAYSDPAVSSRGSQTATMLFIRAQNLMAHDQVPLQSLGQLIESTKYGTNYERLVSDTMKGMRLDVHGLKQIQWSQSNLGTSSDSVVRDLVGIVTFQGDVS
ncbi:unnamed protein product [Heligmosomoides polygyrus]|uniref:Reverse transcriptase n=1 Tax=Heligmosomoides polygyrus TaxID=6339 RepID=A0A183GU06_HELPZ|nr:unnamed protein product [Heligmosomoides polygyrus]